MYKKREIIIGVTFLILSLSVSAQPININLPYDSQYPDHTRIVFVSNKAVSHRAFLLPNPKRLVIDFNNARLTNTLQQPPKNHVLFARMISARRNKQDLRVVIHLKKTTTLHSFTLKKPNHRLAIDLFYKQSKPTQKVAQTVIKKPIKNIIIAVDAGHGGNDSGAIGRKGTQEKKVVLAIAKKLTALIDKQVGMQSVMTRKGDYYIKLRRRMEIALSAKANLFVSIHADAFKSPKVKGASVFTVSKRGASSEAARWLADHENSFDKVGGVKLADRENTLATVLIDLSQTGSNDASWNVANKILKNLKRIGHLHKKNVQKAGFVVLKSPIIPSILVETAFISNPDEERKLRTSKHQAKIAMAIFKGIVSHFRQYAPANTHFAINNTKHRIIRGETLSGIAFHYGVSTKSIKIVNALTSNKILIGQVLKIPKG